MNIQDLFRIGMDREIPDLIPDKSGMVLNLGAGNKHIYGAISLDYPEWDAEDYYIPVGNEEIDQIHAYHFFEHISNPPQMLRECQRVLKVGGHINIVVPYYTSQMQAHDLFHKSKFCEETWRNLFNTPYYSKNREGWRFKVGINIIIGIVERNICLMTQLIKE